MYIMIDQKKPLMLHLLVFLLFFSCFFPHHSVAVVPLSRSAVLRSREAEALEVANKISPNIFAFIRIAISIGVSIVGAVWGIYITGSSLIAAAIKASQITSKNLIRSRRACGKSVKRYRRWRSRDEVEYWLCSTACAWQDYIQINLLPRVRTYTSQLREGLDGLLWRILDSTVYVPLVLWTYFSSS